jgi:hypothetical protein
MFVEHGTTGGAVGTGGTQRADGSRRVREVLGGQRRACGAGRSTWSPTGGGSAHLAQGDAGLFVAGAGTTAGLSSRTRPLGASNTAAMGAVAAALLDGVVACSSPAPVGARQWVGRSLGSGHEAAPEPQFLVGRTEGLGGRVAAGNSPARAGDSSPGAASGQPPHMSMKLSISRTTSFPVYERPYPWISAATRSFRRFPPSAIADDRGVDQAAELGGHRRMSQRLAVEGVHPCRQRDARHQPHPFGSNEIGGTQ